MKRRNALSKRELFTALTIIAGGIVMAAAAHPEFRAALVEAAEALKRRVEDESRVVDTTAEVKEPR
ncbi:MAG: hypothetical protein ICCCNLDF_02842 [Planctomycetes bacterium]|nr:hypothetical protein [Planctomycetota bacterium]